MSARIEVRPVDGRDAGPPSSRQHYLRHVAANGETLWHSEAYATRSNARRAARRFGLPVWEFDAAGVRVK